MTGDLITEPERLSTARTWAALLGLAAGAFLFVTLEVLPMGLTSQLADGLGVSQRTVGLLITGHAGCVVLTTIPLTAALARVNRRWLLVGLLAALVLGGTVAAAAPSFPVLFAARVLVAAAQGVFWTMSAALAATLVGPQRTGRAVAVVFGGISLAQVAGAPLFTYLGQVWSWRASVALIAALAAVTAVVVLVCVPDVPGRSDGGRATLRPALANRRLLAATTAVFLSFAAVYVTLTYFAPVTRGLTGAAEAAVPGFLLVFGLAGIGGNALAGALVDRRLPLAVGAALGGVVVAAVVLVVGGDALLPAVVAIGLWGLSGSAFPTTFQTWALSLAPDQAESAGALVVVAVNLGIATGALLGGALFDRGPMTLVLTTAGLLVAVLAALGADLARRRWG